MDETERRLVRRIASTPSDALSVYRFISHLERLDISQNAIFNRLRALIGGDSAELFIQAFYDEKKHSTHKLLEHKSAPLIQTLTKIFEQRNWIHPALTHTYLGFVDSTSIVRITAPCSFCGGTGTSNYCTNCESPIPCIHYEPGTLIDCLECRYGNRLLRTISVFEDTFLRFLWLDLRPPNFIFGKYPTKDCCNFLFEYYSPGRFQNVGITLHGYVENKDSRFAGPTKFHHIPLDIKKPELKKVIDSIYSEMIEIHSN